MSETTITTTTVTTPKAPREIPEENARAIIAEIEKYCSHWSRMADTFNWLIGIFGFIAIVTSVVVSIYTGTDGLIKPELLKLLACISTIALGLLTAFNLVNHAQNARTAWRALNSALMMYQAGEISIVDLIRQYQKGENQLGVIDFKYGSIQGETTRQTTVEETRTTKTAAAAAEMQELSKDEQKKAVENVQVEISNEKTVITGQVVTKPLETDEVDTGDGEGNVDLNHDGDAKGSETAAVEAMDNEEQPTGKEAEVKAIVAAIEQSGNGTLPTGVNGK